MAKLTLKGLKDLEKALKEKERLNAIKRVVLVRGGAMQNRTVRNAVFVKGYQTGTTRRSVRGGISSSGLSYTEGPTTHYAYFLEYGTRFMQAQPFVGPAFNEEKPLFKKELEKLMK